MSEDSEELDRLSHPIRVTVGDGQCTIFEKIFEHFPISFGRGPQNTVRIDYPPLSRSHCIVVEEDGKFYLIDLKSSNGIAVNGEKVEKAELKTELVFHVMNLQVKLEVLEISKVVDEDKDIPTFTASVPPLLRPEGSQTIPLAKVQPPPGQLPEDMPAPPAQQPVTPATAPRQVPLTGLPSSPHAPSRPATQMSPPASPQSSASASPSPLAPSMASSMALEAQQPHASRQVEPVLGKNFEVDFSVPHPGVERTSFRKLEAIVMWHDVVYDTKEFGPSETVTVGPSRQAALRVPIFNRAIAVAHVGNNQFQCQVRNEHSISLVRQKQRIDMKELQARQALTSNKHGYSLMADWQDVATIDLGYNTKVHLRFVPASAPLSKVKMLEPDEALKKAAKTSVFLHLFLAISIFLTAPPAQKGPKLKNVPERYARLLLEKPKPKPPPPPPQEKPEKKEVVKALPKEKPKIVEKRKVFKNPKVLAKRNKYPMEVKHPIAKAPPPVKVEALGALGALGAVSNSAPANVVTNININKDAGGLPSKSLNTGGIIGALPSSNGRLAAGGNGHVKTKGLGYGSGTGYGIQGLKGTAGSRNVAGVIVGQPKLASFVKQEGLSRAQVMAVVHKYLGEVQHCYEKNLLSNPDLSGRMEFEWDISPAGRVTDVRIKRSTVNGGDSLGECVKSLFASMKFPAATNGMITTPSIGFPFGRL